MRRAALLPLMLAACVGAPASVAPPPVPVAPTSVLPGRRTLAQEIAATPALASFAAQLRASGDARMAGAAPVTVFAADEAAHARLAPGIAAALLEVDNRALLTRFVAYHLVDGALDAAELRRRVAEGGGRVLLPTLAGEAVVLTLTDGVLTLTDGDGDRAYLTADALVRANGVLHVVNGVIAPTTD